MSALTGFTTLVNGEQTDILYIFEGYSNVLIANATGFKKNDVDIRSLINGWEGGTNPFASNTGFKLSNGNDIAAVFQKKRSFVSRIALFTGLTMTPIWMAAHNGIVVIVSTDKYPYISRNMGRTFTQITGLDSKMATNCKCVSVYDNNIIMTSGNSFIQWSKDYGNTWSGQTWPSVPNGADVFENVAAFVDLDGIYLSPTGGGSWNNQNAAYSAGLRNFRFIKISKNGSNYIAICSRSTVDLPTTAAQQLELVYCTNLDPTSTGNVFTVCTGVKPYTVALSGLRGICGYYYGDATSPRIQYTTDGGQTWTNANGVPSGTDNNLYGIRTMNMSGKYCVASSYGASTAGAYLYSSDYGVNWTRVPDPYNDAFFKSIAVDKNIMIASDCRPFYNSASIYSGTM